MSLKLIVKNLNVKNIEKNLNKQFEQVDSTVNINDFLSQIAQQHNLNSSNLDLMYDGELMDKSRSLSDYIHDKDQAYLVLIENQMKINDLPANPTDKEIQELSQKIQSTFKNRKRRDQLENYLRNVKNIASLCNLVPLLNQDAVAYGFIQSIDLILQLSDFEKAKIIIHKYPLIYHALKQLIKLVIEEIKSNPLNTTNFVSKGAYSIDDLSDDEDNQQQQANRRTNSSGPVISQDHLSAVLAAINQQQAAAQQQQQQQQQEQRSSGGGLTIDYFQNVMQQLLTQSLSNTHGSSTITPTNQQQQPQQQTTLTTSDQQPSRPSDASFASGIEKMHEFGFWDDEKNLRALQITEGNVEAAISLLLEGIEF